MIGIPLNSSQRAIIELPDRASAAVLGAPRSGKTTTLSEALAERIEVRGWDPAEVLALTTTRESATQLRDRLALRVGRSTPGPLARSINSLAFECVSYHRKAAGLPAPRILTGGEQDADIAHLLAEWPSPWPDHLSEPVRTSRTFRSELRELMARCVEHGLSPQLLAEWGEQHGVAEWSAAAPFVAHYLATQAEQRPHQFDSAQLIAAASDVIDTADPGPVVSALRMVVVDDFPNVTQSHLHFLRALTRRGVALIAFGDPDVAINSFRGGSVRSLGQFASVMQLPQARTFVLDTVYRQHPALRGYTGQVVDRIGAAAAGGQRRAALADMPSDDAFIPAQTVAGEHSILRQGIVGAPLLELHAATHAKQWAGVARLLREHHFLGRVPWQQMLVVVRSGSMIPAVTRALALAEVPTHTAAGAQALRDDPAVRALIRVIETTLSDAPLTAETITEILLGPFGGFDRLGLRKLRVALRTEELSAGGNRGADELLVEAFANPGRFATIDHRVARHAAELTERLATVRQLHHDGATVEELLWSAWHGSSAEQEWVAQAGGVGLAASDANRHLDGIVALFSAAKRFVERDPFAASELFIASILDAEVPEDTLSPQSRAAAVRVTTPSRLVGTHATVVAIGNLQDGVWPNLRTRGTLFGAGKLADLASGIDYTTVDERKQVRDDELRMFALAVTRASSQVILSAVVNEDEAPSQVFSLTPPGTPRADPSRFSPLTLRGLTGELRKQLVGETSGRPHAHTAEQISEALAQLARAGAPGAAPDDWHGVMPLSSDAPLYQTDESVPVSPSRLAAFEDSPVDWFIDTVAGTGSSTAMGIGTLVHWVMEGATDPSLDALITALNSRWHELQFEAPWVSLQQRRAAEILTAGVAEYLGDFARDNKTLVAPEIKFALREGRAIVHGAIDRIEADPSGGITIVDLKTGQPVTAAKEIAEHPQLGLYQLAYLRGHLDEHLTGVPHHHSAGAKLLFVKSGVRGKNYREAHQAALSEEQLAAFSERLTQAAAGMAAAHFSGVIELDRWTNFDAVNKQLHRVRAITSD